jgi:hypothetical protein
VRRYPRQVWPEDPTAAEPTARDRPRQRPIAGPLGRPGRWPEGRPRRYSCPMQSKATTAKEYLASLPPDRRKAVSTLRSLIRKNLPAGYQEIMQGMISWVVPLSRYPNTYNGQPLALAGIASQKKYISL